MCISVHVDVYILYEYYMTIYVILTLINVDTFLVFNKILFLNCKYQLKNIDIIY